MKRREGKGLARWGRSARGRLQAGYTMIELSVAVMVFAIGFGAISTTVATTTSLSRGDQEHALALEEAQSLLDEMRTEDFAEVFVLYNRDATDDPGGPNSAPGAYFDVPGLTARTDDPDGFVGEVIFPGDGFVLLEDNLDGNDRDLGMPRDLNNDGVKDQLDHSGDYIVLPVRVRLEWQGASGERSLELASVLTRSVL